ncbi:hypothetical protein ACFO1B_44160 [Dactylosporangium siamense]|uniref:Uncharacterized protein n=1 Tax=Dactylosporangium siamense TaxID=685454 RepID=A0A919PZI4_9ACTN|nr:hypothetical protein [Dactylosporangium siamense]GIG51155.1 hypothetical protein Dsi01nite_091960 [Dactylosporangium siamense]
MTDDVDAQWIAAPGAIEAAETVWVVQLADRWLLDPASAGVRDALDLAVAKRLLRSPERITVRRLLHYDPPSDLGGAVGYERAKLEHEDWLARVRRQLAYVGAAGSMDRSGTPDCDYLIRLVILPRAGRQSAVTPPDGIWIDTPPPDVVLEAWAGEGLIALDPHEENVVGPYSDRNPLWVGIMT